METLRILEIMNDEEVLKAACEHRGTGHYAHCYGNEEAQITWEPCICRTKKGYAAQVLTSDGVAIWVGLFDTMPEAAFAAHHKALAMVNTDYAGEGDE